MIKVGIVGASGYSGLELVRLLLSHPEVEIEFVAGTSRVAGKKLTEIFPILRGETELVFKLAEIETIKASESACIFLATPNETSLELVPEIINATDKKVIDLSGAFRLKDKSLYPPFYGFDNNHTDLLNEAVYGLPELNREHIFPARLVANPGCYPTSILIPLVPFLNENMLNLSARIIADSKSGVTGAGRKPTETTHYVEVNESFKAYNIHKHRHEPEISQELSKFSETAIKFNFSPHLLPVNRGILSTIYAELKPNISSGEVYSLFNRVYGTEKFVRVLPEGELPEIKFVSNTHYCDIGFSIRNEELIIVSAIDNLLKGASSQAVQNFNLMFDFKEDTGL